MRSKAATPLAIGLCIALTTPLLGACGTEEGTESVQTHRSAADGSNTGALGYTATFLRERFDQIDGISGPASLTEWLPNAVYASPIGGPPRRATDLVVIGKVRDVAPGAAFALPDDPEDEAVPYDGQRRVAFDSSDAAWRTVHATVDVTDVIAPQDSATKQLTLGISIDASVDVEHFMRGLRNLGPAVFFTERMNPVFAYDPNVM